MTALDLAGQLLAIGGAQVAIAAGWTLIVISCLALAVLIVAVAARHAREALRTWREQHPRQDADAAWADWVAAGIITSSGRAALIRRARAADLAEAEADAMYAEWKRQEEEGRG